MEQMVFAFGGLAIALVCLLAGKYTDPFWRTKMLRSMFKKNLIIVSIVSKDSRTIREKIVNVDQDTIELGERIWIVHNGSIYRKDKPEARTVLSSKAPVKFQEGLPVIYVNEDTLESLNFFAEDCNSKPQEVASILNSWLMNKYAKGFGAFQKVQNNLMIILCVVCLLSLVGGFLSYLVNSKVDTMNAKLDAMSGVLTSMQAPGSKLVNGTIVIKQPGLLGT